MRGGKVMPAVDMGSTKMRPADVTAPAVTPAYTQGVTTAAPSASAVTATPATSAVTTSAAPTVAATPSASAATMARERQICAANPNGERTETCGKPQYQKPG